MAQDKDIEEKDMKSEEDSGKKQDLNDKTSNQKSPDSTGDDSAMPDNKETTNGKGSSNEEEESDSLDAGGEDKPANTEDISEKLNGKEESGEKQIEHSAQSRKKEPAEDPTHVAKEEAGEDVASEKADKDENLSGEKPKADQEEKVEVKPSEENTVSNKKNEENSPETDDKDEDADHKLESEHDLKEKDQDDDHEDEEIDYSSLSKEELVDVIKELARSENVMQAERKAKEVKHYFDEYREKEREEALKKFVEDGGDVADFAFRPDELMLRFDANYQLVRDRKQNYAKNRERQKDENLKRKQEILEKLREFVDSEETNISFDNFKKFQEEWKSIGPVPGAYARTLWANYNALVDRFYDNRSIYFELKELDRRKNLEAKIQLCERAEELLKMDQITEAVKELNELHHEFKHIGPVPKDEQEALWQRFKGASDAIYERRKIFVDKLKSELDENMKVKSALAEKVEEFARFDSDRIKAWNSKTKEILEIQKKWENTGGLPRAHAKEINKQFWSNFKAFFSNKNQFFKKLDAEREQNLEKKQEMVKQAKELKDSEDLQSTAEKLKQLQRDWREIGPVPGKYRESVYQEFKSACDEFFERKRASRNEASKEYVQNYEAKKEICKKIEALAKGDEDHVDKFKRLQEQYNETGFVPRNKISEIKDTYAKAVDKYIKSIDGLDDDAKEKLRIENEVSDILHSPNADQKLYRKEQALRKQISTIENDIAVWKNNLEFFADSKKADKLKDEFQSKIDSASDELQHLKKQLRIIRTAG